VLYNLFTHGKLERSPGSSITEGTTYTHTCVVISTLKLCVHTVGGSLLHNCNCINTVCSCDIVIIMTPYLQAV